MKVGDTVRFLNAVGGGKITKIDGQVAYVCDSDGFETPMLIKELVVVLPAGHDSKAAYGNSAKLMFDQKAADAVKARDLQERKAAELTKDVTPVAPAPAPLPVEETLHGEKINLTLAFEPADIKHLSTTTFAAVLVNDSNYYLNFTFLLRDDDDRAWKVKYAGEAEPNMLIDLANISKDELPKLASMAVQCIAYKKDKSFTLKSPISALLRPDLTKFYKLHCFRPGIYFDNPVLEFPLVHDDMPVREPKVDKVALQEALGVKTKENVAQLQDKYRKDLRGVKPKKQANPADNPHKLLPLIEIDLHIAELVDTTAGMDNAAMLDLQLSTALKVMSDNSRRIGQKIVFIHGKGDGVLRKALWERLRKYYPKAELQDASFREYGFGATLVTIH